MKTNKNLVKYIGRGCAWTSERIISELALPFALLSATSTGNYLERGLAGVTKTFGVLKYGVSSYLTNEGVRDFVNNSALSVMSAIGSVGTNIKDNPEETLYAALGTFGVCKAIPFASKRIRKSFRNNRKLENKTSEN